MFGCFFANSVKLVLDKRGCACYYTVALRRTTKYGRVVELVDSLDSGSSVHCGRAGSSPASPTKIKRHPKGCLFVLIRKGLDLLS